MTLTKTTAGEVREAEARGRAIHLDASLSSITVTTEAAQADPMLAAEGMEDQELADAIAALQVIRQKLGQVEHDLTHALGKRLGRTVTYLSDGRQAKLERSADRKEWDHEGWKHDARRAVVDILLRDGCPKVAVDPDTGEEVHIGQLVQNAVAMAQEAHGSTSPRVTSLRALGLVTTDYCTSTPGSWRLNVVKPTEKKDTTDV